MKGYETLVSRMVSTHITHVTVSSYERRSKPSIQSIQSDLFLIQSDFQHTRESH